MTNDFPRAFARQYDSHLKHLKLKGLQPKTIDAYAHATRRRLHAPDPATRPAQGLPAGAELRLSAPQPQRADRLAASRAQDCAAPAGAGESPTGVPLPLLRYADAGHPAADSAPCRQTTKFGTGRGDGRVSHRDRKDGAPAGAMGELGLKMLENGVLTAEFAGPARFKR